MYTVYILKSQKDGRSYAGYSRDVARRLREHNAGRVNATKKRIPFVLIYSERFQTEAEAKQRESWWKSGSGRKEMKKLFET